MRALALALLLAATPLEEDPTGNWNLTLQVGHIGEGLRTVILEVSRRDDGYRARLTSLQNRMTDADEATFDGETLEVAYGSYRYHLHIEGDVANGSVTSPTGTQEVTARRQKSQLFVGDEPEAYQKTWSGRVEKRDGVYVIATRRNSFDFTNADGFREELEGFVGKEVAVTGFWRVDKIEIQKIEARPPR